MHVDRQAKRPRSATNKSSEIIELPYCEGIQVGGHSPVSLATSKHSALMRRLFPCLRLLWPLRLNRAQCCRLKLVRKVKQSIYLV